MEPPRLIDAASPNWNIGDVNRISAIVAINVIHISSFDVTLGILNGANKYLDKGGFYIFMDLFFRIMLKQRKVIKSSINTCEIKMSVGASEH